MHVSRCLSVLIFGMMVLSTYSSYAQGTPRLAESDASLPDAPSTISQSYDRFDLRFAKALSLKSTPRQSPNDRWVGLSRGQTNLNHLSFSGSLLVGQEATLELGKMPYFTGVETRQTSLTTFSTLLEPRTVHGTNDWGRYGQRIPWAGQIAVRVGQKAKAHPRVVNVLKVVQPQF